MSQLGPETTTDQVVAGISLAGRTALVTGATSGLGVETARALAESGADVVLLGRDLDRLRGVNEDLQGRGFPGRITRAELHLDDLDSVRRCAGELLAEQPQIHLLVNNAGVMACPLMRTKQGFELQFGTNHVGHFLFTCLLVPALIAGAPARVVNLSSAGHRFSDVDLDDPNFERADYEKWRAYGASKTANVLFTVELDRRLRERGVRAFAVHPGVIQTDLARHLTQQDIERISSLPGRFYKTVPQGAATSVWAATAPELADRGGLYLEDCHIAERSLSAATMGGIQNYAIDATRAARLWAVSEELVGQSFDW